jgi:hypothetical protein
MKIKTAYYYFFYKLYKFYESSPWKWWSEWKASLTLTVLTFMLLFSISGYYLIFTHVDLLNSLTAWLVIAFLIMIINYVIFHSSSQWKEYNAEFNKWSVKKNRIGSLIVLSIALLVLSNLVFMFYLMSRIDWTTPRCR